MIVSVTPRAAIESTTGLTWLRTEHDAREVASAWRTITPMGARAFGKARDAGDTIATFQGIAPLWTSALAKADLLQNKSETLLSLGGYVGNDSWELVRVLDKLSLLNVCGPEPEFIVMNPEKTGFVALTTEEHEFLVFCAIRTGENWTLVAPS
jgi:hypothetical protein